MSKRKAEEDKTGDQKRQRVLSVTVAVPDPQRDTGPFVVEFPQGPPSTAALEDDETKITFLAKKTDVDELKGRRQLVINTRRIEYTAANFGQGAQTSEQTWIGIMNKKSNELTLVPAPMYSMRQQVKGYQSQVVDNKYAHLEGFASRQLLIDTFASKRQRTIVQRRIENRIKEENTIGMGEQVQNALATIQSEKEAEEKAVRKDLPAYDLEARKTSKIYDINSIISARDEAMLAEDKTYYLAALHSDRLNALPDTTPGFVKDRLRQLCNKRDLEDDQRRTFAQRLQFLTYLIEFFRFTQNKTKIFYADFEVTSIPREFIDSLAKLFAEKTVIHNKPALMKSTPLEVKLIHYICVLALAVSGDFTVPVHVLANDLNLKSNIMKIHFQQCGCVVAKQEEDEKGKKKGKKSEDDVDEAEGGQDLIARLKAPLKLPALIKKRFNR